MIQQFPHIPENAPFTPEQRAWLNGFLAGLFSRAAQQAAAPPPPARPVSILFASQTGNAESVARRLGLKLKEAGWSPAICDVAEYPVERFAAESLLLIAASTYGDGDPPDGAKGFWEFLNSASAPRLGHVRFAVLALGDSNYSKFCGFGRALDQRFDQLGAQRLTARVDCDGDFELGYEKWIDGLLPALQAQEQENVKPDASRNGHSEKEDGLSPRRPVSTGNGASALNGPGAPGTSISAVPQPYSKKNPFPARVIASRNLNAAGSAKETRHVEISLHDSGIAYEPGDALAVRPRNCPELVETILRAQSWSGGETVAGGESGEKPLRQALAEDYELGKIHRQFLEAVAERSGQGDLRELFEPANADKLRAHLWGRDILDFLEEFPTLRFEPGEFVQKLKKLLPRMYSIASSPRAHPGEVHLTVGVLRYELNNRVRKGVGSTFLAERALAETAVPVFVHPGKNFRLPSDGNTPIIMVGPGTGIAPFRAFLEERSETGAAGKNWLFFGDQRESTDFLYRDEILAMRDSGLLTKLNLAFSRDQSEKIYVQDRMIEEARDLFAWIEAGAHFYVCGDATRMAKDVDQALHRVIRMGGDRGDDQAAEYVKSMEREKRYQKDVY